MPPESPAPAAQPESSSPSPIPPTADTPVAPEVPVAPHAPTPITAASETPKGHGQQGPTHTHCENCGTELKGPFCHACGQHDFDVNRSFAHTALEALENFFHFDAKFFRNIITLLFRPGVLTAEFNAGKRAAQMPPFRLYVFVSVLFFFVSLLGREERSLEAARAEVSERSKAIQAQLAEGVDAAAKSFGEGDHAKTMHRQAEEMRHAPGVPKKLDPAAPPPRVEIAPGVSVGLLDRDGSAFERFLTTKGRHALADPREFRESFLHAVPKMLLVCLPIFALYTRLLFRRSGQLYLQHLIGALHFHTFFFLFLLARNGWAGLAEFVHLDGVVRLLAALWLAAYPALMLRRMFGEAWPRTIIKAATLVLGYALTLLVAFLATVFVIFLTF